MCAPDKISMAEAKTSAASLPLKKTNHETEKTAMKNRRNLEKGVQYGTASLAFLFVAITVTMPHAQSLRDDLGCDSMCLGSMTSVRSMLTLTGATVVGKLSDSTNYYLQTSLGGARRMSLFLGGMAAALGLFMAYHASDIRMLWASMIPGALLQQNANVLKALFSAYHDAVPEKSSSTDRAASAGLLGMAVGLALMAGPLAGVSLFSTYQEATYFGFGCVLISLALIVIMPTPATATQEQPTSDSVNKKRIGFFSSFDIPTARTPAALFLMASRLCMTLAFHIFQTIWTASLNERFDFGPKDYGRFISFIGLTYAISQGFLAKALLKTFGGHTSRGRVRLLLSCCVILGCGRYLAFQTSSIPVVYALFAGIVTCLGLINTMFSADTSQIAPPEELGSLFGVLAAVESAGGIVGPILGGALSRIHPVHAPLFSVLALYGLVFCMVILGYDSLVLKNSQDFQENERKEEEARLKRQN